MMTVRSRPGSRGGSLVLVGMIPGRRPVVAGRASSRRSNLMRCRRARLCRRHGTTTLRGRAAARDTRSADVLRSLQESHTAGIGANHHAWETPPSTAEDLKRHLYALGMTPERFDAQLEALTTAIEDAVGARPVSYRSGRFGFSASHVSSLERAGYLVDSSVSPLFAKRTRAGRLPTRC